MNEADLEKPPDGTASDETDINLRAYLSRISDERLQQYDPSWSDEQLIEWDGNFRCDGALFLICSERDVDIREYRRVLEEHIALRGIAIKTPSTSRGW
jgi:hypothetical protein